MHALPCTHSPIQCPITQTGIDESTGKEEQVLLPDNLSINLLDVDLQNQILDAKDMDIDIKSIIETITKEGPTNM